MDNASDCRAGNGSRPHILVIDDEAGHRALLKEIFLEEGFDVSEAGDGREALNQIAQIGEQNLSLIVVDLIMPRLGGIAFIRKAQETFGDDLPPILICTARTDREMVELAKQHKVAGYVLKPYKPEFLMKQTRQVMRGL